MSSTAEGIEEYIDLEEGMGKARGVFVTFNKIWNEKTITLQHTKIRIFNFNVKSVLCNGRETWVVTVILISMDVCGGFWGYDWW